jgi:hypothetical protein|tara:strand:- start:3203 stop:4060 length:858 start_codon:yes stop_codon:yes gene_type:complete
MKMNNTTSGTETVETVEENVETNEVEAEEVEAAEANTDDSVDVGEEELMTIEELLGLNEEDYDEFTEDANHKGMKPLHEWMQHIPEDVRKHVANIRSSYTRKTQELSEMRKALEFEKSELMRQQEHAVNNPFLKRAEEELATDEEYDLYTPEGMQKEIKRQAAQMLQEMMKPAQEEMQIKQRRMQLEQFKTENPDLMDDQYRLPVAQMLQERPELKLEDAFYIVKSKVDAQKLKVEREQVAKQKSTRRETLRKTSSGKSVSPKGTPQFRDAWEAFQYHKNMNSKK